ncbi:MAG: hypothetical protein IT285_13180 [Bdellovibrionales bacterium]|nr:hypothetical protein [Bdellovibrionales bacterium]
MKSSLSMSFSFSFALIAAALASGAAQAVPAGHVLVSPDRVQMRPNGRLAVTFKAPCARLDWQSAVMTSDDTGDREVAVGIVVPTDERSCEPGPMQVHTMELRPEAFGYAAEDGEAAFGPMSVAPLSATPSSN